ncbi:MAG: alpha/beta hydrolase [Gammaproteobacteria bacterium]|nr:alpha/beta hydrolase [Gammaproteobacteria bacterium]
MSRAPLALIFLRRIAVILVGVYAALVGWLWWNQESLLFLPEPLPAAHDFRLPPDVYERRIPVDGATLSALHLRLPEPGAVVFYLHGNSGNLAGWFSNHDFYREANVDLFMIDYRGYGKSTGSNSSEAQLLRDVRAAWAAMSAHYADTPKVIFGRSLGSGPAAILAVDVQPSLTVLISPYCSLSEMARSAYPWAPSAILRYPLDTCAAAPGIDGPLLLVHGDGDSLIPPQQSRRILERAPRAELAMIPGAGHNDVHRFGQYRALLRERLLAVSRSGAE